MVNNHSGSRAINRLTVKAIEAAFLLPSQTVGKLSDGAGPNPTKRRFVQRPPGWHLGLTKAADTCWNA